MAMATYNATLVDGLPVLRPGYVGTGQRFQRAHVRTVVEPAAARREEYVLPGLSGAGSRYWGLAPARITWDVTGMAASWSDLNAFIGDCQTYKAEGGRYALVSEHGQTWNHVELVDVRIVEGPELVSGTTSVWVRLSVEFRDMQPAAG